ncbi:NPCBM/NEW2 domain-containing protein [Metabacillus lacus]|uniref:NPCBM/NEW2 domain-containing protein n=1 Tax=Metabacillus lacus TaxID=1983721 RepID=UPI0014796F44|nr:NPCBM/NEW2 domain-containing protein [Metabacillus lacus]
MKRKLVFLFLFFLLITGTILSPKHSFAAPAEISLTEIKAYDYSGYFYVNQWSDTEGSLTDVNGRILERGLGLFKSYSDGGTASASYNIDSMGYKTFKTGLTLDSKWITGDFGKTAVAFYSDDILLYEKQLSKTDGILDIELKLPSKIKNFHIIVKQISGAKGTQRVVLKNPLFSTSGTHSPNESAVHPSTIGSSDNSGYYENQWDSYRVFQEINGNIVTGGVGLTTNRGGTASTTYNIDNMGYNVFQTKLSLDSKWTVGDYGRSAVGIYADDYLLYEKEITPKTAVQSIKLNIPKGTKNLAVVVKQLSGAKGTQGLVLINPLFKKTNDKLINIPKRALLTTVGATDTSGHYYTNGWGDLPFQYYNGQIVTAGVGLTKPYSYSIDGSSYAEYDIRNMGFNALKTTISLDSKWLTGDYGTTRVSIYADNKVIYTSAMKKSDVKNLTVRFPGNTKKIKLLVNQVNGAKGAQRVVFGNAVLTSLPVSSKLETSQVSIKNNIKSDDIITVSNLSKNEKINVYNSKKQLVVSGTSLGSSLTLKVKQLGSPKGTVYITRTSSGKLESDQLAVGYSGEPVSAKINANQVSITNNKNKDDVITVKSLNKGDVVKVYGDAKSKKLLGSGTVSNNTLTIKVKQLGTKKGTVYITRESKGKLESPAVAVGFKAE